MKNEWFEFNENSKNFKYGLIDQVQNSGELNKLWCVSFYNEKEHHDSVLILEFPDRNEEHNNAKFIRREIEKYGLGCVFNLTSSNIKRFKRLGII